MADPMDYTINDGHAQPARTSNTDQCQFQPPPPPTSLEFTRDTHHYDPVHNTDSWHGNGSRHRNRRPPPPPPYAPAVNNTAQWAPYIPYGLGFPGEHRASQEPGWAHEPQLGFMSSPWAEVASDYDQQATPFGYVPGVYGENDSQSGPSNTARNSQTASTHPQGSPMRRYPTMPYLSDDHSRRAGRPQENSVRTVTTEVADPSPSPPRIPATRERPDTLPIETSSRRHDIPDWGSDDDDDPLTPSYEGLNPRAYTASLMFHGGMDSERRMAAARGAVMAVRKSVPSKDFVASLEKLNPMLDLKEADRTCMICYNEFEVENPDGIAEHPIRLPKCKHVFGDLCIKKWFEESDSCPYCRDKLPSEPIHRKHPAYDSLYQASHARRLNMAAQASAQMQAAGVRSRAAYPYRASEGNVYEAASRDYSRPSQQQSEDFHYIMRAGTTADPWSYSPPNRSRESEARRRQARGRASLGRLTSIGATRLVASPAPPNPQNVQRPHFSINPNTFNAVPGLGPRRSITPGLTRQHSTSSVPTVATPPRSRLSESSSQSSEETSPPVAVGSGSAPGDRHSPTNGFHVPDWGSWSSYASSVSQNEQGQLPIRSPNSRSGIENSSQSVGPESRSNDWVYPQRHSDFNLSSSGSRW